MRLLTDPQYQQIVDVLEAKAKTAIIQIHHWDDNDDYKDVSDDDLLSRFESTLYAALTMLRELKPVEPVAWRYPDAKGNYRYRGYVVGFDVNYKILKPIPLFAAEEV